MKSNLSQFRRRFSLQPTFLKNNNDETERSEKTEISQESKSVHFLSKPPPAHMYHKIVIMGASKVGKSSIIQQFLLGTYSEKYKKTIEEMHHVEFNVNDSHLTLDILDTSGSNDFPAMRMLSISSSNGFILVFDVTDLETFDYVRYWRDQIYKIKANRNEHISIVVVANKIDLVKQCDLSAISRLVEQEWQHGYVEATAKNSASVMAIFKELLLQSNVSYNLSPALKRYRRQSLPSTSGQISNMYRRQSTQLVPSSEQICHLQNIQDRIDKRGSCVIS